MHIITDERISSDNETSSSEDNNRSGPGGPNSVSSGSRSAPSPSAVRGCISPSFSSSCGRGAPGCSADLVPPSSRCGAAHSAVEEPFQVRSHLVLPFAAEVPFPLKESPAVTHVGLLRFPCVPPQLQLGLDPVEDGDFVVGKVGMSPIAPHSGFSKWQVSSAVEKTVPVRTRDRRSGYVSQPQRVRPTPANGRNGCECSHPHVPSFQISNTQGPFSEQFVRIQSVRGHGKTDDST